MEQNKIIKVSDLAKKVVKEYGCKSQLDIAQERCAKLIVAISHYEHNCANSREEVREEVAEVAFVIYQLMEIVRMSSDNLANMIVEKCEKGGII